MPSAIYDFRPAVGIPTPQKTISCYATARPPPGIFSTYSHPSMLWIRSAPVARMEQHASKRARRSLRKRAPDVVADLIKRCRGAVAVSSGLVSRLRDPFL